MALSRFTLASYAAPSMQTVPALETTEENVQLYQYFWFSDPLQQYRHIRVSQSHYIPSIQRNDNNDYDNIFLTFNENYSGP